MKAAALNHEIIWCALLSGILTGLPVVIPGEGLLLTVLTPVPLIILSVKYPWRYGLGVIGIEAGALWLVGDWSAGFFLCEYVVIALSIAWAVRRVTSLVQTIIGSILASLTLGGILLVAYGMITQQSLPQLLTSYLDQIFQAVREQLQPVEQGAGGQPLAPVSTSETLAQFILTIFPALVMINHLFTNVLNYLFARSYCARSHPPLLFDTLQLSHWRVWEPLVWVFLASGAALLLPWHLVNVVGLNVFLVTLAIYFLQGFAIVVFWGQRVPFPSGVRWLLLFLLFVMTGPLSVGLCIAAGLFDLWVDFRRLRQGSLVP